jgi:hypothetical protein
MPPFLSCNEYFEVHVRLLGKREKRNAHSQVMTEKEYTHIAQRHRENLYRFAVRHTTEGQTETLDVSYDASNETLTLLGSKGYSLCCQAERTATQLFHGSIVAVIIAIDILAIILTK